MNAAATAMTATAAAITTMYSAGKTEGDPESGDDAGCCEAEGVELCEALGDWEGEGLGEEDDEGEGDKLGDGEGLAGEDGIGAPLYPRGVYCPVNV